MAAQSGNQGYISLGSSDIQELKFWDSNLNKNLKTYGSRSGAGWTQNIIGNKTMSGTIRGNYDPTDPINDHVDTDGLVALELHLDENDYYSFNARLGEIQLSSDLDTGDPQEWSCTYESSGAVTFNHS